MEWLFLVFKWILVVIKWIVLLIIFLFVLGFLFAAALTESMARDERKMYKGMDSGWMFLRLVAIIFGVLGCIFAFLGYLLI